MRKILSLGGLSETGRRVYAGGGLSLGAADPSAPLLRGAGVAFPVPLPMRPSTSSDPQR
jgi:hypothetical protein